MSQTQIDAVRVELKGITEDMEKLLAKKGKDDKPDWSVEEFGQFQELKGRVESKYDEYKRLETFTQGQKLNAQIIAEMKRPAGGHPMNFGGGTVVPERKSLAQLVAEDTQYKSFRDAKCPQGQGVRIELDDLSIADIDAKSAAPSGFEFKAPLTNATGFPPFSPRINDVVPYALRRVTVPDLMPRIGSSSPLIRYMEQTTFNRTAAPVAEGGLKPYGFFGWTERVVNNEVMATLVAVTEQQMMDVPQLVGLITQAGGTDIALVEEDQVLNGNGTSPQLQGFLTKTGVLTQATGPDSAESAIFGAITQIRSVGFTEPSALVIHPRDWQRIVTHQDTTGRFIYGNPNDETARRLWGIPAVVTPVMPEFTALVGDFATFAYMASLMGLTVSIGFVNDDFARNQRTIRIEIRGSLVIRRPSAFCKVTGLPTT